MELVGNRAVRYQESKSGQMDESIEQAFAALTSEQAAQAYTKASICPSITSNQHFLVGNHLSTRLPRQSFVRLVVSFVIAVRDVYLAHVKNKDDTQPRDTYSGRHCNATKKTRLSTTDHRRFLSSKLNSNEQ